MKPKSASLIEFEGAEHATVAKNYLNGVVFNGVSLRIFFSNYNMINLKTFPDTSEDTQFGSNFPLRFLVKKGKALAINPPSAVLHVANLHRSACEESVIRHHFEPFGPIEGIKFMLNEPKNMCLVKMGSLNDSLVAASRLHNKEVRGRKLQISFTRSRI